MNWTASFAMHIMENPLISDVNQLPKIGLALGGGVVRGFAHLGVVAALEEAGLPIHCVTGSSAGSLVGAIYSAGIPISTALADASKLAWHKIVSLAWPSRGLFSFDPLEKWLIFTLGNINIEDLPKSYAAVATDLDTGELIVLHQGKLAPAVRASCSVPGFFVPREIDGRLLGDGSLVESIPSSVARQLGAEYVIGVDILTPTVREGWGALAYGIDALEIVIQRAGGGYQEADCLIRPALAGHTYLRFSKVNELYELGRLAAQEALPKISADLERLAGGPDHRLTSRADGDLLD
jgi:NTE family protein